MDMDGTTLNSSHKLSNETLLAIRAAEVAGVKVIIATGRPAFAVQPYIDQLALRQPVPAIVFNGAAAMIMHAQRAEERVVFTEGVDVETARRVLAVCDRFGWCASCCFPLRAVAAPRNEAQETLLRNFEGLEGTQQERVADFVDILASGESLLKIVAMVDDPEAAAAQAREVLPEELVQIIAAEMHVEFLSPGVSKGQSLVRFCRDELGVSLEDVVAFGDNHNDVDMLKAVGEGVAMANAKDSVKAAAHRVCAWSNDDHGVARELEAMIRGL